MPGKPDAKATQDRAVDEASEDSFPASDPPSFTPETGTGGDAHGDEAKGTPHSDRHASETAAGRSEGRQPAEHKTH